MRWRSKARSTGIGIGSNNCHRKRHDHCFRPGILWDIVVGTGATAVSGSQVKVHYTGWLVSGQKFDSSLDRGEPFSFMLGAGQVIKGWDEGVAGMKVGGKRQLRIPPTLGYGAEGSGGVILAQCDSDFRRAIARRFLK